MERQSRIIEFFFVQSSSHGDSDPSVSCNHAILREATKGRVQVGMRLASEDF